MYAIFEVAGKQYKASSGDVIRSERLKKKEGETFSCPVIAFCDNSEFEFGKPYSASCNVVLKVLEHGKARKITVFTYKPKKNHKRKMGHRQQYTGLKVISVSRETV
jgi:large subunit ribosomal protein L21